MATTNCLQRFCLDGIRDTGIEIGRGSYAVVKEFDFRGLKCVGKEIHSLLYEEAAPRERADMLRGFEEECELLSRLHHPNVVQFLGVYMPASSGLPALVMEHLPTTLSGCVDRHGVLPAEISLGILRDVALGLRYLHEHSPPIIHRDLSANNVLLTTSMSAKISDLGVAKILSMSRAHVARMTQTQVPGTPCYMPPETMTDRPKYTSKVDIFSMGVLIVYVLSGECPIPNAAFAEDPDNPGNYISVSEFERRRSKIEKIEDGHPLRGLIRQCLDNNPSCRPDAVEVVCQVKEVYPRTPPSRHPENWLEQFQQVQSLRAELQQSEALRRELAIERRKSPTGLSPYTRLKWRKGADAPRVIDGAQAVVMGEMVYVDDDHKVCQYDWRRDTWSTLPDCPVSKFGMAQFLGKLITIGGKDIQGSITGKVYQFNAQRWEEFLPPMPTARYWPTIITRSSSSSKPPAIAACEGWHAQHPQKLINTVEVYSHTSSLWQTAKPLPIPCYWMTSVTIDDTCYILGGLNSRHYGIKSCFSASLDSLFGDNATSPLSHAQSNDEIWLSVSDTPLMQSTAASLKGSLIAIGGKGTGTDTTSSAISVLTSDGSWERVRGGGLPEPRHWSAAVCLPSGELLVVGGYGDGGRRKETVFIASIVD